MPVFFALYFITKGRARNAVLFIGSIIFYGWGEPKYLLLLFLSIFINYLAGILISRFKNSLILKRLVFVFALLFDFGMLFFFKYINFFIDNINSVSGLNISNIAVTLPLGISFYTFQIVSYIVDLYLGKIEVERSFINVGTYLSMFPQLIAGPIVVYSQVADELRNREVSINKCEDGLRIFILGLGSKILIANNVGALWADVERIGFANISMPLAWIAMLAYSLQIYFDFNGYSLMAIGLGKMLGFTIPQNFDYPYISRTITEFWRRWHITLSSWFREYVYIPLGGNRRGRVRTYVNLFAVWFLTGFWHGADWNFIIWGLYFFVILMIEKAGFIKFLERHKIFARVYSLLIIGISWMIFAITNMKELGIFLSRLVCFEYAKDCIYYLKNYGAILIIGCIMSTPVLKKNYDKIKEKWIGVIISLVIFVLSVSYLADASYNPFLYFRF